MGKLNVISICFINDCLETAYMWNLIHSVGSSFVPTTYCMYTVVVVKCMLFFRKFS